MPGWCTLGDRLYTYRRSVMLARQTGLTKTYNLVFDPTVHDEDIYSFAASTRPSTAPTVTAYGWDDLLDRLDHGFHPAGRDLRYTIGPWAQREVLYRLREPQPRALRRQEGAHVDRRPDVAQLVRIDDRADRMDAPL